MYFFFSRVYCRTIYLYYYNVRLYVAYSSSFVYNSIVAVVLLCKHYLMFTYKGDIL